jgi:mannose-6-phosphate isomerase
MRLLRNPVRGYAWGSRTEIARLQGRPVPSPTPEAELWVGAHPADPSRVEPEGAPLTEVIAAAPARVLGPAVVAEFGPRLPYLLKLLAAAAPLSLQAHPDPAQAAAGFAAEEAARVPRGAPHRRYVDASHKPELLVAVSPFRALCGFRAPAAAADLLAGLAVARLEPAVAALRRGGLEAAVRALLSFPAPERPVLVREVATAAAAAGEGYGLVGDLARRYPDDVGVVVALLLNDVRLQPGEAIFMPAGNLHAYLHGTGVEIMAASDNVLRGGLTPKYVDVAELLRVLRFHRLPDPVLRPVPVRPGVVTWPVPVREFALHRVSVGPHVPDAELDLAGPVTVLCLAGRVRADDGAAAVDLGPGRAGFAPAGSPVRITGDGVAYVASVGRVNLA